MLSFEMLSVYWTSQELTTNLIVFMNMLGALALGLLVGYERSYHGRAAGMRTYGLVCMASAALTVIGGHSASWFGGQSVISTGDDPTRIIQGIVTGIGFLCAGVIMREGFNISGLTTAASLWTSSVIGVLVGVGFYSAAMALSLLSAMCMVWVSRLETWLPSRQAVAITLQFKPQFVPVLGVLRNMAQSRGYDVAEGTISIAFKDGAPEWRFVAVAQDRKNMVTISELAADMARFEGVAGFQLSYARN
jgi:putative Mg2+ transporter-C (MgtC) family protein